MIQRIQTLWWLIALIFGVAFIFSPYAISGGEMLQSINCIEGQNPFCLGVLGTGIAAAFFTFITIFLFKNTNLQINLSRFALLLILVTIGLGVYYALQVVPGEDVPHYGAAFPVLSMLFIFLAMRGVRKDQKLLRSVDRGFYADEE